MLLPIGPSEQERFRRIEYRRVSLTHLFGSIRSGLPVTRETPRRVQLATPLEKGLRPVVFLRLQSLRLFGPRIDWQVVRSDLAAEAQQSINDGILPDEDVLQPDDYLLSMRGMPRGIGMAGILERMPSDLQTLGLRLAAGNNFIRLRPNPEADCEPAFLHLLLDMLVAELGQEFRRLRTSEPMLEFLEDADDPSEGEASDPKARLKGSFIKVSDLKAMTLNIPDGREDREWLLREYQELVRAERQARRNLSDYRDGFRKHILPRKKNR